MGVIANLNLMDVLILGDRPYGGSSDKIPQGFQYIDPQALGITQIPDLITPEVYKDANNNFIVCFRGTDFPISELGRDAITDFQLARAVPPEALTQAYEFLQAVRAGALDLYGDNTGSFLTIGHSLGGAEALYAAAMMQFRGIYVEGIGIDAPAFRSPDSDLPGSFLSSAYMPNSLFNMSTHGDLISAATTFGGTSLGMIMPAEQIYLFVNPASGYQYGPTGASIIEDTYPLSSG